MSKRSNWLFLEHDVHSVRRQARDLGDSREDSTWKEGPAGIGILKIGQWVAKLWMSFSGEHEKLSFSYVSDHLWDRLFKVSGVL